MRLFSEDAALRHAMARRCREVMRAELLSKLFDYLLLLLYYKLLLIHSFVQLQVARIPR